MEPSKPVIRYVNSGRFWKRALRIIRLLFRILLIYLNSSGNIHMIQTQIEKHTSSLESLSPGRMVDEDLAHRESLRGERAGYRETSRGFNAVGGSQHKVLGNHCEGLFSGKVIIL